ncbi:nitroreductase family protein [Gorillibacterium sp. sgz500922]|uniref:nitroreductase family protein n=1 Tax=Gorillibacterium sp. sgz500922 TaxID=3446694 RepID=UPI003F67BCDB
MEPKEYPAARIIRERRTIKKFKQEPVPEELLRELLTLSSWAPNHGMRQPWRFILFQGEGRLRLVQAMTELAKKPKDPAALLTVPAYLAVAIHRSEHPHDLEEDILAAGALIQNFQLAAWERGIGVKWTTGLYIDDPAFGERIGVNAEEKIIGILQVGYPEQVPEGRPRTPLEEKLTVVAE